MLLRVTTDVFTRSRQHGGIDCRAAGALDERAMMSGELWLRAHLA
jgi:hypothetical protein